MNPDGGPAIPVSVNTDRAIQGGTAIPVYGYANAPTDGRPAQAGAAMPVRVLTAADLVQNGGTWVLEGRYAAMPVYTAPASSGVMGGPAIAVYPINAWPPSATPPVVTPWYLSGGIAAANCVAAYQPKGAASLAASYVNLASPGTHDLTVGVAPTFDPATGWIGNGLAYLITDFAPNTNSTAIVKFTNAPANTEVYPLGAGDGATFLTIIPYLTDQVWYGRNNGYVTYAPGLVAGVLCIAGGTGYRNGVADGALNAFPFNCTRNYFVLAHNNNGVSYAAFTGKIQTVAFYSAVLTAPQVLAVSTAMTAL